MQKFHCLKILGKGSFTVKKLPKTIVKFEETVSSIFHPGKGWIGCIRFNGIRVHWGGRGGGWKRTNAQIVGDVATRAREQYITVYMQY